MGIKAPLIFGDAALAEVVEKASADDDAAYALAMRELSPHEGFEVHEFAGGSSSFVGRSPFTNTHGFGTNPKVHTEAVLKDIESFFAKHSIPSMLSVASTADAPIWRLLGDYRIIATRNVYAYDSSIPFEISSGLDICEVTNKEQLAHWLKAVSDGFAEKELSEPDAISLGQSIKKGNRFFVGYLDGNPVSASCLYVQGDFARLGGMATLPAYRGQGFQTAMVKQRLDLALKLGCNIITSDTQPGNNSQRNLERSGFRLIYVRNILRKD
jgi:GNAT superfamily N-acetyltransferase